MKIPLTGGSPIGGVPATEHYVEVLDFDGQVRLMTLMTGGLLVRSRKPPYGG